MSNSTDDRVTIEEFVERAIAEGRTSDAVLLIQQLPEASREKYREIWKRLKGGAA